MFSSRAGASNSNWRGGKSSHPLYGIYNEMLHRCRNPSHPRWSSYGGRGITVCERWRSDFWTFVADMGPRPEGVGPTGRAAFVLDRKDNDGNYEPENVRWATALQSGENRRLSLIPHSGTFWLGAMGGEYNASKSHCIAGHEFTPANTYRDKGGKRRCRTCNRLALRAYRATPKGLEATRLARRKSNQRKGTK